MKVVEIAGIGPAPFAAMILAELGAEVVRVDRTAPANNGLDLTGGLGRSRPSIAVDLKSDQGPEVVLRLVEQADILIEGMRPGVMERLGLGPEPCLARNPALVYGRMTGWGQDGPWAGMAGHDINYAAVSGALHLVGTQDRPVPPVNVLADFGGGTMYLLVGLLSALHSRRQHGRGQVVDAAMVDGAASLITMIYAMHGVGAWEDRRGVNLLDGGAPFYDVYECADGKFVAVGAIEPAFYRLLVEALGLPDLETQQMDKAQWPRHRDLIGARFRSRTRDEWTRVFEGTDACVAPVLSLSEAPEHPHLARRGVFSTVGPAPQPRVAPRFSETPALDPVPEHAPGADTVSTLTDWGWAKSEIEALLSAGTITQRTD
ncbi:CaiB/BaiF CoA transferase family protein [Knoellia aerolata]|uniref:CaiB/BaiF CoA transferase family protein n=1 Tax=Knoellia aerolata TaxID=442954 RepID=UPI000A69830F|nr:CaiB/BaiF CoA-transferase family protein [Knoellia aerolata]